MQSKSIKSFHEQYCECMAEGLVDFEERELEITDLPFDIDVALKMLEHKSIRIAKCLKFSGDCHSHNFECQKLRLVI